ncbi:MAG: hypothetical protein CMJ81_08600 [Planctomycetaceae bacterium]|jgi:hypothetical protein|nr:hypothetical protein [Planctomycetaceae bacterium]
MRRIGNGEAGLEHPTETREKRNSSSARTIFVATTRTESRPNGPFSEWLRACPVPLTDQQQADIRRVFYKENNPSDPKRK